MYQNVIEYRKNQKRILRHTERKYWVNGLQLRPWFGWGNPRLKKTGTHYSYAFSIYNFACILSWVKNNKSINLLFFKPSLFLLK